MSMDYTRRHTARESALIQKQYEKMYSYCYFKLHNRELAEDITQETFLKYLERYRFSSLPWRVATVNSAGERRGT